MCLEIVVLCVWLTTVVHRDVGLLIKLTVIAQRVVFQVLQIFDCLYTKYYFFLRIFKIFTWLFLCSLPLNLQYHLKKMSASE